MKHYWHIMTAARLTGALFLASVATIAAQAPAPLGNDAWHKVVFENPQIRILSVDVAPGQTTMEHRHDYDIATISVNDGTETRVQDTGKEWTARAPRALGNIAVTDYTGKPSSHRIENVGKRSYQLFAIENKKKSGWSTAAATQGIGTKMIQESRAFRSYDVQMSLNASQSSHIHTSPTIVVLLRGKVMSDGPDAQAKAYAPAPVGLRQMDAPGQWIVVPPGDRHHLVRLGTTDARVVEVEVR
jgi:quercetin dioxygenase-like cupin family protein